MNLLINETWCNNTENYIVGESGVYETRFSTVYELFRALQSDYGKCTGRMYIDKIDGTSQAIGWVFEKTAYYEDTHEPYIQATWVSVHEKSPETKVTHYYRDIRALK